MAHTARPARPRKNRGQSQSKRSPGAIDAYSGAILLMRSALLAVPFPDHLAVGHLRRNKSTYRGAVGHGMDPEGYLRTRWERRGTVAVAPELVRAAPFHAPFHHLAGGVHDVHLDPGMGVGELELFHRARDFFDVLAESRTRVVRLHRGRQSQGKQSSFSYCFHSTFSLISWLAIGAQH